MDDRQYEQENLREDVRERLARNDPIFEPMLLETWSELDLPLRGQIRQEAVERAAQQVAQRRTIDGIATRAANQVVSPFVTVVQGQAEDTIRRAITNNVQRAAENGLND